MTICNGISIDVEEYFHALNLRPAFPEASWDLLPRRAEVGVHRFLRILERTGHKATFFVLGWVAEREPELLQTIAAEGHEIASHGYSHRMAHELGEAEFEHDVRRSLEAIGKATDAPVRGFRASTFSVTRATFWALSVLRAQGIEYDSSIFPVRHDRYGIPDFSRRPCVVDLEDGESIVELPLLTWRKLGMNLPAAGGGYLRQFPTWYFQKAIAAGNREGIPAILYLHPWELDPDQPRAAPGQIGRVAALRHYRNLDRMEERVERILGAFEFGPLQPIAEQAREAAVPAA